MITFDDFEAINNEVSSAVNQAYDYLRDKTTNYILFLANGEYHESLANSHLNLNPYVIDSRDDRYKDEDRRDFFINFIRSYYSFPNKESTDDDLNKIHLELMVYSHIWESKPFLRQLYRLAILINGKTYPWIVDVPNMSKHEFIRFQIRDTFKQRGLEISKIISNGFHTSLRNAFAHSEYHFNKSNKHIVLDTYKGNDLWDIRDISFNDWTKRFAYSMLLCHYVQNMFFERRAALPKDFGTNRFIIIHPKNSNVFRAAYLIYDHYFDTFNFESNLLRS